MKLRIGKYRELLLRYLRPQWRHGVLLSVLLLSTIALQLLNPQLIRAFIDTATAQGSVQLLTLIACIFLGVAVLTQGVKIAEAYVSENVAVRTTNLLRSDLLAHCLQLDPGFHSVHTPGELMQRIDGDVSALGNFFLCLPKGGAPLSFIKSCSSSS